MALRRRPQALRSLESPKADLLKKTLEKCLSLIENTSEMTADELEIATRLAGSIHKKGRRCSTGSDTAKASTITPNTSFNELPHSPTSNKFLLQNGPGFDSMLSTQQTNSTQSSSQEVSSSVTSVKRKQAAITSAMVCKRLLFKGQLKSKAIHEMLLALIIELASIPAESIDYKYQYIKSRTAQLIDAEKCELWIKDPSGTKVEDLAELRSEKVGEKESSSVGNAAFHGDTTNYRSANAVKGVFLCSEQEDEAIKSLLTVPIIRDSEAIGALKLVNKRSGPGFTESDTQLAEAVAMITSLLLRCGMLDVMARKQQKLAAEMLKIATLIASTDFEKHDQSLLDTIVSTAKQLTKATCYSLFTVDQNGKLEDDLDPTKSPFLTTREPRRSSGQFPFSVGNGKDPRHLSPCLHAEYTPYKFPPSPGSEPNQKSPSLTPKGTELSTHRQFKVNSLVSTPRNSFGNNVSTIDASSSGRKSPATVSPAVNPVFEFPPKKIPEVQPDLNSVLSASQRKKHRKSAERVLSTSKPIHTDEVLSCPVLYENTVVGVAVLSDKNEDRGFTTEDLDLLQGFTIYLGVTLRNIKQQKMLRHASLRAEQMLVSVGRLSIVHSEVQRANQTVSSNIIEGAREIVPCSNCTLYLVDKEKNHIYSADEDRVVIACGSGIAGTVSMTGVPKTISRGIERDKSILCCPVYYDKDVVAVLELIKENSDFTCEDVDIIVDFSKFVGICLYNNTTFQFAVSARDNAMVLLAGQQDGTAGSGSGSFNKCTSEDIAPFKELSLTDEERRGCKESDFDILSLRSSAPNKVILVLLELLQSLDALRILKIDEEVLLRFLVVVRLNYRKVHYHNFCHAADTCHTVYCYLINNKLGEYLTEIEKLTILLTAVVHDVDHMGLNNSFHYKTETPMGILSSSTGSTSVLEVHHCNKAIDILAHTDYDIFASLSPDDQKNAYKIMINSILCTDMARHKELHDSLESVTVFDKSNDDHRGLLMKLLLKSADISNITKPFAISKRWAVAVTEEFYCQGDREKQLGASSVAPMFDREREAALAQGQIGFIESLGMKHFTAVAQKFPSMQNWVQNMRGNLAMWNTQLSEYRNQVNSVSGSAIKGIRRLSTMYQPAGTSPKACIASIGKSPPLPSVM